jgi:hypothetical protein
VLTLALVWGAGAAHGDGIPDSDDAAEEATRPAPPTGGPPARDPSEGAAAPAEAASQPVPLPPAEIPDPAARLPKGGSAVEYWDLTSEFDSGHRLFVRFAVTNEGPGDQLGFATGELVSPKGEVTHFRNGRQKSRWTLSRDRLRLDIGKSHLDLHGPRYRLEVAKSYVKIDLSFPPRAGMAMPAHVAPEGSSLDLLALAAPTEGTIWLEGMSNGLKLHGRTAAVHTVMRKSETMVTRRTIELLSQGSPQGAPQQSSPRSEQSPNGLQALYVVDFTAPSGKRSRWLRAVKGAGISGQSDRLISETAFEMDLGGNLFPPGKKGKSKEYWIPDQLGLSGDRVAGEATLGEALVERDPLSDLPQPLRFFAGRKSSPRRVWSTANFAVTLHPGSGPPPLQFQSRGVATVNFTNPLTRR